MEVVTLIETDVFVNMALTNRVHHNSQRGGAVAAEFGLVVVDERVITRSSENRVKTVILVRFTRTNLVVQHNLLVRVDVEGQRHRAVAAKLVVQIQGVVEGAGLHLRDVETVLGIGLSSADVVRQCGDVRRVHGDVQRHGAVAAKCGVKRLCLREESLFRGREVETVRSVAFSHTQGGIKDCGSMLVYH